MWPIQSLDSSSFFNKNYNARSQEYFSIDPVSGEAYTSHRAASQLCGIPKSSVVHYFKDKDDISQGVTSASLASLVQHYATEGKTRAIETLCLFAKAGAKAFIHYEDRDKNQLDNINRKQYSTCSEDY